MPLPETPVREARLLDAGQVEPRVPHQRRPDDREADHLDRASLEHAELVGYDLLFDGEGPFLDDQLADIAERARVALRSQQAVVNIMTPELQMSFDSAGGFAAPTPRSRSMCHHALPLTDAQGLIVVEDAGREPAFAGLPWVTGEWGTVRFYAMAAIVSPSGVALGTVCCFGDDRRSATAEERAALRRCADTALQVLEERRASRAAGTSSG